MPYSFTVKVTTALAERLKDTETEIRSSGGSFEGDVEAGAFQGNSILGPIRGNYQRTAEDEISITITEKPFLVPGSLIEAEIKNYFA